MIFVTLMSRGHTFVQSKWFSHAQTPSGASSASIRPETPLSRLSNTNRAAATAAAGPIKCGIFIGEHRAGRIAGAAEDAFCRIVKTSPLFRASGSARAIRLPRRESERLDFAIFSKKTFWSTIRSLWTDIDRSGSRVTTPAFDRDFADHCFAGEAFDAVDAHGVGPADPVGAAFTQGKGAVEVLLDIQYCVEYAVGRFGIDRIIAIVCGGTGFRIESLYAKDDFHLVFPVQ